MQCQWYGLPNFLLLALSAPFTTRRANINPGLKVKQKAYCPTICGLIKGRFKDCSLRCTPVNFVVVLLVLFLQKPRHTFDPKSRTFISSPDYELRGTR